MIDFAKREDSNVLKCMWHEIFGDEEDTLDFFFENVFAPENTLVWRVADRPEAMLYMIPNKEGGVYLYALATNEKYRNQGIMSELIKRALDILKEKGAEYAFLMPASKSLFAYYEKFGFTEKIAVTSVSVLPDKFESINKDTAVKFAKKSWERECSTAWDDVVKEYVLLLEDTEEEYRFVSINTGDVCHGYMVLKKEAGTESVVQYGMTDECFGRIVGEECVRENALVFSIRGKVPHTINGFIPF